MTYTLSDIQQILQAGWLQKTEADPTLEHLLFDSRSMAAPAVSLFFALPGKHRDGHRFIPELYAQGVRQFVVSQMVDTQKLPEANILKVENTLDALQALAAFHRARFKIPVIGITGSNGKTVVKEWLAQLLSPDFDLVRSPKSYNSQIGVPLSVWQMQPRNTLAIFEAGISQPGEMERLEKIIRPTIGVFTNLGPAHQEGFSSDAEKLAEKMRLFERADTLVCEARWAPKKTATQFFTWSKNGEAADLKVLKIENNKTGGVKIWAEIPEVRGRKTLERQQLLSPETIIGAEQKSEIGNRKSEIAIPFSDPASIENALHCWAVMLLLGIPQEEIEQRMLRLEAVEMRLEVKAAIHGCTLINDAYSNDLASLRLALQFARQQAGTGKLTLILSDILQSGQPGEKLWKVVAEAVRTQKVARIFGIGTEIAAIRANLPATMETVFYPDTEAFLEKIAEHDFQEETILLKGARAFTFERIARRLEQKAHKTVLEVNLSALAHNLKTYQRLLQPGAKMMVMVKAEGYGAGSAQVAKLLEFHQVDYLGVAYADEGIALRQSGVNLPILVLNPEPASFDVLWRFRLEPEVYSLPMLDEIAAFASAGKPLGIHLKLDTGMHRLGFEPADIPVLVEKLREFPSLHVVTVFSHLAASDAAQHDDFTRRQAAVFSEMFGQISNALGYKPLRHICNTGGIEHWPEFHFDMVRLGIGLYGIGGKKISSQLQTVNSLKATISQIKTIAPGETVGYNRNSGPLTTSKRIATISIGYADGLLRLAGGGRFSALLRGQRAPTIGNICMDMTMLDVTQIPDAQVGDDVTIFGENAPVQDLAECLQTIPYEVFTNVSERVKRVYWQE
ncbi:MAG: bifunctional UDP-N-acetylmuramoyl-tripeptide:D-alanyl-D-alanine ligase/alanine racemase [Saprospiraceae bacterium]|nr:bifunctional UDP-N-acetylmuramoyl-tripeptide:D-alanyl-D-alanine ligase/alanine racemase [Saprospiraceae bacterium]